MNKNIQIIKKRFAKICNRISKPTAMTATDTAPIAQQVELYNYSHKHKTPSTSGVSSTTTSNNDYCQIVSSKAIKIVESSSSGYTSESTEIAYHQINDACSIKSATTTDYRVKQIQYLLDYQIEYLGLLNYGLENYIRPLSALINDKLYFQIFQNIEKLYTITKFLRNTICDAIKFNSNDVYVSTLSVLNEYISTVRNAYEVYLSGYTQACVCIKNPQVTEFIQSLNIKYNSNFNLIKFINLPLNNLSCIYTTMKKLHSNDKYNECVLSLYQNFRDIYVKFKVLRKTRSTNHTTGQSTPTSSMSSKSSSCNTKTTLGKFKRINSQNYDYMDLDGNKYYFV